MEKILPDKELKAVLVNYNFTPDWVKEYNLDYWFYDRSDDGINHFEGFPPHRILKTENIGNVDFDKLGYIVDFYDNLPDIFLWGKSNLFKYITQPEFDESIKTLEFKPLLIKTHVIYSDTFGPVNYYQGDMYYERNDSWYLRSHPSKYFRSFNEWCKELLIKPPNYIPFPPGGNFILTKERVHRYGRDFYAHMREMMGYCQLPGEAQMAERTYYLLWQ